MGKMTRQGVCAALAALFTFTAPALAEAGDDLRQAARMGDVFRVAQAISNGADVNEKDAVGNNALVYAIESGHVLTVKYLIASGIDLGFRVSDSASMIDIARQVGSMEMVALLQDALDGRRPTLASLGIPVQEPTASQAIAVPSPSPTPKPVRKSNVRISPLVVSTSELKQYKVEKTLLETFNSRIAFLNEGLAKDESVLIRLSMVNGMCQRF